MSPPCESRSGFFSELRVYILPKIGHIPKYLSFQPGFSWKIGQKRGSLLFSANFACHMLAVNASPIFFLSYPGGRCLLSTPAGRAGIAGQNFLTQISVHSFTLNMPLFRLLSRQNPTYRVNGSAGYRVLWVVSNQNTNSSRGCEMDCRLISSQNLF